MTYLYRFDTLKGLREQSSDPYLRAKRVTSVTGAFDHHQVVSELEALRDDQGVYRFCFWRTWAAAVKNMHGTSGHNSPWVLQRVRADYPTFGKFKQDDDQYLKNDAWIYWQTNSIEASRPDWSPDGISHDDIEVLTPDGCWERLSTSDLMRDASFDGWRCLPVQGANGPAPVFTRALVRRTDDDSNQVWVLLRQNPGPWSSIWHNPEAIGEAVWHCIPDFRLIGLKRVRWVVSLECQDRILSAEVFPTLCARDKPSLLGRLFRRRTLCQEDFSIIVDDRFVVLDTHTQKRLYRDFGIEEVLLLNRRYEYSASALEPNGRRL
jgi:hypothetical protein